MAKGIQNFPNINPPDSDYPSGSIKDDTGANDGTPIDQETNGDIHEFFAKLMRIAGIIPNGMLDNEYVGHQYIEAINFLINKSSSDPIIRSMISGPYTTGYLVKLWGATVAFNLGGTSSVANGAIFYNGKIYNIAAASISTPTGTLVFKIDASVNPNVMYLQNGVSGSGLADYDDTTKVKILHTNAGGWTGYSSATVSGATVSDFAVKYKIVGRICHLSFQIATTQITNTDLVAFTLPAELIPLFTGGISDTSTGMLQFVDNTYRPFVIEAGTPVGPDLRILLHAKYNGYGPSFDTASKFGILTGSITFEINNFY